MDPIETTTMESYLSLNMVFRIRRTEMQLTTDYRQRTTP
jgi:hypothetical protein